VAEFVYIDVNVEIHVYTVSWELFTYSYCNLKTVLNQNNFNFKDSF